MLFAVCFTDDPARAGERPRLMAAHLAFLEANRTAVRAAGPLLDGEAGAGGLWLVEAPDAAAVFRLVEADPFWPSGLRQAVRIRVWRQVFAAGRRLA